MGREERHFGVKLYDRFRVARLSSGCVGHLGRAWRASASQRTKSALFDAFTRSLCTHSPLAVSAQRAKFGGRRSLADPQLAQLWTTHAGLHATQAVLPRGPGSVHGGALQNCHAHVRALRYPERLSETASGICQILWTPRYAMRY